MSPLLQDITVLVVASALVALMVYLSRRVRSGFVLWSLNVFVTFCLWFFVFAVANLLARVFGRDPSESEGGEWVFWIVYGAVFIGWFVRAYASGLSDRARWWILGASVAIAVVTATLVNISVSPPG